MKTKLSIVSLVLTLIFSSCSSEETQYENTICYFYIVYLSEDCECDNYQCREIIFITEEEYNRLLAILEGSNQDCVEVEAISSVGDISNGYLIELIRSDCPTFF